MSYFGQILIGFEESQTVCKAFREMGFMAYSCDIKPCSGGHPEWHLQMDIFKAMGLKQWDFIGLHPVCTKMALSGNRTYAPGKPKNFERIEAVEWTINLWLEACKICDYVYMENPMGAMNRDSRLPKPQIIQPYYFGDHNRKTTCLWLHGLPCLLHSETQTLFYKKTHVPPNLKAYKSKRSPKGYWMYDSVLGKVSTSNNNEKSRALRSKTFPGIANAMAEQWGNYLIQKHQIKTA